MAGTKDKGKRESVLENRQKFEKSPAADKLAHMGSKPATRRDQAQAPTSKPKKK